MHPSLVANSDISVLQNKWIWHPVHTAPILNQIDMFFFFQSSLGLLGFMLYIVSQQINQIIEK